MKNEKKSNIKEKHIPVLFMKLLEIYGKVWDNYTAFIKALKTSSFSVTSFLQKLPLRGWVLCGFQRMKNITHFSKFCFLILQFHVQE